MLKLGKQYLNLPALQKRILLHLAHEGAKTRNEVKEAVGSAYKNILFAFNSLLKKGLIKRVGTKIYRQRKFPQFWLTNPGMLIALSNNANPDILKKNAEKIYGKSEELDFLIDMSKIAPLKQFGELYFGVRAISDIALNDNQIDEFLKIIRKYPTYMKAFEKIFKAKGA